MLPADERVTITTGEAGDVSVVLRGEIDIMNVPDIRRRVVDAAVEATGPLLVDLAEVTFLDSTGLTLLVALSNGAPFGIRVHRVSPVALRVISLAGLDRHFGIEQNG